MKFGICLLSVIPMRSEAADQSEMISQLLFGEMVVVIDSHENWLRVRNVYDGYEGWVVQKQLEPLDEDEYNRLSQLSLFYVNDLVEVVTCIDTGEMIPVTMGAVFRNPVNSIMKVNNKSFSCSAPLISVDRKPGYLQLKENAMVLLNAPYLWGGKSPFGIDCSGFTQLVYSLSGITLLRDASMQSDMGESISFLEEARPGDLLFFDNDEGQIVHVGILLENNKIIHASGKVRMDAIDHQGIFNSENKRYSHNLRLIRRVM